MAKKINIGILIDESKNLNDGEIKTIFEILQSNFINIKSIFKINSNFIDKNANSIIHKIIFSIEKRYSFITISYQKKKIKNKKIKRKSF